jgi:hypothetical protein
MAPEKICTSQSIMISGGQVAKDLSLSGGSFLGLPLPHGPTLSRRLVLVHICHGTAIGIEDMNLAAGSKPWLLRLELTWRITMG